MFTRRFQVGSSSPNGEPPGSRRCQALVGMLLRGARVRCGIPSCVSIQPRRFAGAVVPMRPAYEMSRAMSRSLMYCRRTLSPSEIPPYFRGERKRSSTVRSRSVMGARSISSTQVSSMPMKRRVVTVEYATRTPRTSQDCSLTPGEVVFLGSPSGRVVIAVTRCGTWSVKP